MVRGAAKAASQEKNAKKQAAAQKCGSQLGMGDAAMSTQCAICMVKMPTLQNLKDHYVGKHPKECLPAGLEDGIKAAEAKKKANEEKKKGKAPPGDGPGKKKKGGGDDLSLLMEGLNTGKKKK